MESGQPCFVTANTIAKWYNCDARSIPKRLNAPADVRIRYGTTTVSAWFVWRLFPEINCPDLECDGQPLFTLIEAARYCGLTRPVTRRRLTPCAQLQCGYRDRRLNFYSQKSINELRNGIMRKDVRVQPRSMTIARRGAYLAAARHRWVVDQVTEERAICTQRREVEYWSRLV
jgi:hypothetical protein